MLKSGWICKELLESYIDRPSVRTRTTYGNSSHVEEGHHEGHWQRELQNLRWNPLIEGRGHEFNSKVVGSGNESWIYRTGFQLESDLET